MCEVLLESDLIPLNQFPSSMINYPREYVKITRPEDLEEFDYISNLTKDSIIDFSKFRITSSDLSWKGIYYLLPIAQRKYLQEPDDSIIDFFEGLSWLLEYDNGIEKLVKIMKKDDIKRLKDWFCFLLRNKNKIPNEDFIEFYEKEIIQHVNYLKNYLGEIS
ncbi:hypothetical protein RO21_11795 [[Actinobacillus] muris]|uniref:Uncharacterized protein n=1 Tax=Muribacter muris TaxID=67855 RepID=A0A0J5S0R1_9PAST|nr:hypothetical protein [Muribacter muris]KMK50447.1 hypothetical protein RO21_11795 [[Actinobacillus] muris] [Muribacter muris]